MNLRGSVDGKGVCNRPPTNPPPSNSEATDCMEEGGWSRWWYWWFCFMYTATADDCHCCYSKCRICIVDKNCTFYIWSGNHKRNSCLNFPQAPMTEAFIPLAMRVICKFEDDASKARNTVWPMKYNEPWLCKRFPLYCLPEEGMHRWADWVLWVHNMLHLPHCWRSHCPAALGQTHRGRFAWSWAGRSGHN